MAVTKIWKVTSNLVGTQKYITNSEKTTISSEEFYELHEQDCDFDTPEEVCIVSGINCSAKHAIDEFNIVKRQYNKTDGILAYHGFISFAEGEVTPRETLDIAKEYVNEVWGSDYQVLLAVHLNVQHLHCHFLINSVSFVDGHMLHDEKAWFQLSKIADEICERHGKSVISEPNRGARHGLTDRELACKNCLDRAMEGSKTLSEFMANINSQPCIAYFPMHKDEWTIVPEGWTYPVPISRLGKNYEKDAILDRFPDSDLAIERYIIPDILDDVDYEGIQEEWVEIIKSELRDKIVYDESAPHTMCLKRGDKKEINKMVDALEYMKANKIYSEKDISSFKSSLASELLAERGRSPKNDDRIDELNHNIGLLDITLTKYKGSKAVEVKAKEPVRIQAKEDIYL